jgi:glycosyltransferase involved in cell wall biosynthesis
VKVDIKLSNEVIKYDEYDLLHFFNVIRPADILSHIKATRKPYVVSTIYLDYKEYDKKYRGGAIGLVNRLLGGDAAEYLKVIARRIRNGEKISSSEYLLKGHYRSIQYVLKHAAFLLPNSHNEYKRIVADYGVENNYEFIPNAIEKAVFYREDLPEKEDRKYLLCVARIDQYKNQLNLIRAVKNSPYKLKLAGKPSPNHLKYYNQCVKEAAESGNIEFTGQINQHELTALYLEARVHILPSWFETTGLSSLEAGALGCELVIVGKGGDTREYFGDYAYYCEPDDVASIRKAIDEAYNAPPVKGLRERILQNFTWEETAAATLKVYEQVVVNTRNKSEI